MVSPEHLQALFDLLESQHPEKEILSPGLKDFMQSAIRERSYRRKHLLLNEDQVPSYAWYIIEGSARVYHFDHKTGREITSWFWYKGDLMLSIRGFFRQWEAGENIELLSDSILLSISATDLKQMAREFPEYRLIERVLMEMYKCRIYDHTRNLLGLKGRDRFLKMMESHREIFNIAYLKDIACFLNMHPTSISYFRARIK